MMSQSLPGVRWELKEGVRETAWGTEQENQNVKLQLVLTLNQTKTIGYKSS